ncbi:hypothetical protein EFE42_06595 [Methanohalophilus sp. RSK]|uniref:hypothetical protein n=1 Tax=Methanohalophilus sp. RSK TaxID=2485783 RepID=UPI000F43A863|nr:hypothetical protein [Methanohalophilus sp. RSK]RNI13780.1 hypothetical protein EFE42_06595 [Methanohalophilus sp. RSK]
MNMWEQKLRDIFQTEKKNSGERSMQEMNVRFAELNMRDFFKHVVFPAYDGLKKEIEKYGRTVKVNVDGTGMNSASLTVYAPPDKKPDEQVEEFYFEIRGRAYQKAGFAFPQHADEEQPRIRKVEILLRHGPIHEYDIENLTREDIIECFVAEYSKWINY